MRNIVTNNANGFFEMKTEWAGVFPAVTTKLQENGDVDLHATQGSIERLIQSGVSGIIVLPMYVG